MPAPDEVTASGFDEIPMLECYIVALPPPDRPNAREVAQAATLPVAHEVVAGAIWPPVKGRAALAVATSERASVPDVLRPWAPPGAFEIVGGRGWVLHSSERWRFETEAAARYALLALVRRQMARAELLPDVRALVVAPERGGARLWLITPALQSLREKAEAALQVRDLQVLSSVLADLVGAVERLRALGALAGPIPGGAAGIALQEGRPVLLALDEGDERPTLEARDPVDDIAMLIAAYEAGDPSLSQWMAEQGRPILDVVAPVVA